MVILDTDHVSLLQRHSSIESQKLTARLSTLAPEAVATTIITYEEQTRGWFAFLARAKNIAQQVIAYDRLEQHLTTYRNIPVLAFDEAAATVFQRLQRSRPRIGAMDLKIAAIALAREATLLSRNLVDFRRVPGLIVEDWTS